MKRLLILTLVSILFSSAINVVLVINMLSLNHQIVNITSDTKSIVTSTNKVLNTSLSNQHVIIGVQKNNTEIFKELFANQTKAILEAMNNKTNAILNKG